MGPDFSARYLHELSLIAAAEFADDVYSKALTELDNAQRTDIEARVSVLLKTNGTTMRRIR